MMGRGEKAWACLVILGFVLPTFLSPLVGEDWFIFHRYSMFTDVISRKAVETYSLKAIRPNGSYFVLTRPPQTFPLKGPFTSIQLRTMWKRYGDSPPMTKIMKHFWDRANSSKGNEIVELQLVRSLQDFDINYQPIKERTFAEVVYSYP